MPTTPSNLSELTDLHGQANHDAYLLGLDLADTESLRPARPIRERRGRQRGERPARQMQRTQQRTHDDYRARTGKRRASGVHRVGVPRATRRRIGCRGWARRIAVTLLLGACLAALVGVPSWALTSPTWRVRHIIVEGTHDPIVIGQIRRLPLAGCDIFRCDLAHDARLIAASPLIAQASVTPQYPATLVVGVRLRAVAMVWQVGALALAFGADGVAMGAVGMDGRLALDPTQRVGTASGAIPGVIIAGLSVGQAQQITHIDENLIAMAAQLRLPVIAGLLNLAPEALTLTYQWAADQGFVATTADGMRLVFGRPEAAATMASALANPQAGYEAPTGETPDAATVAQGVDAQLSVLRALLAWLARAGQRATLIDLRWGAYPYYRIAA